MSFLEIGEGHLKTEIRVTQLKPKDDKVGQPPPEAKKRQERAREYISVVLSCPTCGITDLPVPARKQLSLWKALCVGVGWGGRN